jgi:hypothetical protein
MPFTRAWKLLGQLIAPASPSPYSPEAIAPLVKDDVGLVETGLRGSCSFQVSEASVDVDNDRFGLLAAMTAYTNLSYAKSLTEAVKLG